MSMDELFFRRKFSFSLYKNLKLRLAEADFSKDVTEQERADKYPVMFSSGDYTESVCGGKYRFEGKDGASVTRFICPLYPNAMNELTVDEFCGGIGFVFEHNETVIKLTLENSDGLSVNFECNGKKEAVKLEFEFEAGIRFAVLVRKSFFDVYIRRSDYAEYICTFSTDEFADSNSENFFKSTSVGLVFSGLAVCTGATVYDDSGISQADIRPVYYENGEVMTENGRMFFTATLRAQVGGCQGVLSWIPGTAEFELTGTLFFDTGDGRWETDVATCLVFDRRIQKWLLWVCSFSHGHILGHASFEGEPRFGRNVIDITLVEKLPEGAPDTEFGGKKGDEDPALVYDAEREKWMLAVCRVASDGHYRYYFFESDNPFEGFVCVGSGLAGSETGGSFFRYRGELYFICGNGTDGKSNYRAYKYGCFDKFENLCCDRPDGGFRGWGSVFSVKQGTRERIYWLTFDRQLGSDFNWSYGNLHCFEA